LACASRLGGLALAVAPYSRPVGAGGETYDVAIVGGGIVGLATAYQLTRRRPGVRVVVLEKEHRIATHQTGHNSGVIHSGIYYAAGSRKARYAAAGARATVAFCREYGLQVEVTGKVIVATSESELGPLERLYERGRANGVRVERLDRAGLVEREPRVSGVAGLYVADTGICDFTEVARMYARLAVERGAQLDVGARVNGLRSDASGVTVHTVRGEVRARQLVACAGLHSDRVAAMDGARPPVRIVPFRGEYYELAPDRRGLVRGLVYPVPNPDFPFLGVHLTRMIDGSVHVGPNAVLALRREGYRWLAVDPRDLAGTLGYAGFWRLARANWREGAAEMRRSLSRRRFADAARRLLPDLRDEDLVPAGAGVRAQAVTHDGSLVDAFLVVEREHALHVLNAPSPAATASLPIGAELADRTLARLDG
jgi:(S)-2-hydroxyglutarate dehydrogenase